MTVYQLLDRLKELADNGYGACNVELVTARSYVDYAHRREYDLHETMLKEVAVDEENKLIDLYGEDIDGGEE